MGAADQNQPLDALWTVHDVCRFLGVGKTAVYQRCQPLGDLPCIRLGAQLIRFDPAAVRAWAASKATQRAAPVLPIRGRR